MIREVENPIQTITLTYADGTTKTVDKGFIGSIQNERLSIEFSNMSGEEILTVLYHMLEFAARVVNEYEAKREEERPYAQSTKNESRR